MKSFTLPWLGYERWVIKRQPPEFVGTNPMGDTLNVDIGFSEKGPKTLPSSTSFNNFDLVISLWLFAEIKLVEKPEILGPVYARRNPSKNLCIIAIVNTVLFQEIF